MKKAVSLTIILALLFSAIGVLADGINLPASTLRIEDEAFMGNTAIESVSLNDGVKAIGARAFRYCSALQEIYIPDSVESIGEQAFDEGVQIYCNLDSYAYDYVRDNGYTLNLMGNYTVLDAYMEENRLTATVANTRACSLQAELLNDDQTEVLASQTRELPPPKKIRTLTSPSISTPCRKPSQSAFRCSTRAAAS